ncbi:MAG: hypothetical protein IPQ07_16240 [Myxococcales bacterium]|nr:hypothetical protein [Myxococcales bacterium]
MRIDVLDLGSNTFHVLTADVVGHELMPLFDASVAVRLGDSAFADGVISPEAFARGLEAIDTLIARVDGRRPVTVATGVFREVSNAAAFLEEVKRRFDLHVTVISGVEEARLTFRAVRAESTEPDARLAVFDLGGGSLECMLGERGVLTSASSLPLGGLRLSRTITGLDDRAARVRTAVLATAGESLSEIAARQPHEVVLSSGTARALLSVARRQGHVEQARGWLPSRIIAELARTLDAANPAELAALGVGAARLDTIAIGAQVFATILEVIDVPCVRIASGALREGLALDVADACALDLVPAAGATRGATAP